MEKNTFEKAKNELEETQEVVEEVEVNEEEVEWRLDGGAQFEEQGGDLNPAQVRPGREEEMNCMVKTLGMFDFGSWQEAITATKWIDRVKKENDEREFVRCRLVARDFKTRGEGPRDDLFAVMPPLEAWQEFAGRGENRVRTK